MKKNKKIHWGLLAGTPILVWGIFLPHAEWAEFYGIPWVQPLVIILLTLSAFSEYIFNRNTK